jgi:hypothetical protein
MTKTVHARPTDLGRVAIEAGGAPVAALELPEARALREALDCAIAEAERRLAQMLPERLADARARRGAATDELDMLDGEMKRLGLDRPALKAVV